MSTSVDPISQLQIYENGPPNYAKSSEAKREN